DVVAVADVLVAAQAPAAAQQGAVVDSQDVRAAAALHVVAVLVDVAVQRDAGRLRLRGRRDAGAGGDQQGPGHHASLHWASPRGLCRSWWWLEGERTGRAAGACRRRGQ